MLAKRDQRFISGIILWQGSLRVSRLLILVLRSMQSQKRLNFDFLILHMHSTDSLETSSVTFDNINTLFVAYRTFICIALDKIYIYVHSYTYHAYGVMGSFEHAWIDLDKVYKGLHLGIISCCCHLGKHFFLLQKRKEICVRRRFKSV